MFGAGLDRGFRGVGLGVRRAWFPERIPRHGLQEDE